MATCTPDYASPSNACLVQAALGLPEHIPCFDVSAGCTGFLYGLETVRGLLALGEHKNRVLLIGCDQLSRVIDMTDRSTCVLFGDGAGAAVLARKTGSGMPTWAAGETIRSSGSTGNGPETTHIHMDGPGSTASRWRPCPPVCIPCWTSGLTLDDIDWIVPHQANRRIIETAAKRLHAPLEACIKTWSATATPPPPRSPSHWTKWQSRDCFKQGRESDRRCLWRRTHLGPGPSLSGEPPPSPYPERKVRMKLNEILGTKFPFIQGGMANIATGAFAAAVSNAGALGLIGAGGMSPE